MNLRQQLETLVWGFSEDLNEAESADDLEKALRSFSGSALPVIKALDKVLTGKTDCTAQLSLEDFTAALMEGTGCYVVYLSDGGYSRLCIDPWADPLVGLDRSLSREPVLKAWDAMGPRREPCDTST